MRITEELLRRTIRETLDETRILESDISQRLRIADMFDDVTRNSKYHPDIASGKIKPGTPVRDETIKTRRNIKALWNELAKGSEKVFKDDVLKCHVFCGYPGVQGARPVSNLSSSKNELSCFGLYRPGWRGQDNSEFIAAQLVMGDAFMDPVADIETAGGIAGIAIIDGRVTWAANADTYSESLSGTHSNTLSYYASSGTRKRPSELNPYSTNQRGEDPADSLILDEEDIKAENSIYEMYVGHWKISSLLYCFYEQSSISPKSRKTFSADLRWAQEHNIPVHVLEASENRVISDEEIASLTSRKKS
jgi:hypothetical protein